MNIPITYGIWPLLSLVENSSTYIVHHAWTPNPGVNSSISKFTPKFDVHAWCTYSYSLLVYNIHFQIIDFPSFIYTLSTLFFLMFSKTLLLEKKYRNIFHFHLQSNDKDTLSIQWLLAFYLVQLEIFKAICQH